MENIDFGLSELFGEGSDKLTATLTIKADVNGVVSIDGSDVACVKTGKPIQIECGLGQHIIKVTTEKHPDLFKETIQDIETPGRNYLVIIEGLAPLVVKAEKPSSGFFAKLFGKSITAKSPAEKKSQEDHEWVDLGLSVKWATCNVGASSPSDYGSYFAWGETTPKIEFTRKIFRYCAGFRVDTPIFTKYNTIDRNGNVDNKTRLEPGDDAARANWGSSWRMPTAAEWNELRHKCSWKWTKQVGKKGYKVTSNINGNSIFLPAAGRNYLYNEGSDGYYWSSSLYDVPLFAWSVGFSSDNVHIRSDYRYLGFSVRPVKQ